MINAKHGNIKMEGRYHELMADYGSITCAVISFLVDDLDWTQEEAHEKIDELVEISKRMKGNDGSFEDVLIETLEGLLAHLKGENDEGESTESDD